MKYVIGDEKASDVKYSQVYYATHNGEGQSLPYMRRSFISFTYGGEKIEDFNLIATISGDRINRDAYASFEDTVTTYDNLDGQEYWATHYKTNRMDFTLSTDGIDEKQLEKFKHWFKAGVSRELILAEHPNRAIMARVSQPPTINLLPFEHDTIITISGQKYNIKTTLYKGDISLSLIMDQPYWYGLTNILGKKQQIGQNEMYQEVWHDVTTNSDVNIFASQDALKILYEDGIPLGSMIIDNMLLGNGEYATVNHEIISKTWSSTPSQLTYTVEDTRYGACIDSGEGNLGIIAGAIIDINGNGIITLAKNTDAYFFYSGTAPSPTIISFELIPQFHDYYISNPYNSYEKSPNNNKYNIFTIESETKQELRFTTPNIFTSYNNVIYIFNHFIDGTNNWEKIREILRDTIRHSKVREFAIAVINATQGQDENSVIVNTNVQTTLKENMQKFLIGNSGNVASVQPVRFEFNSKTGEAQGTFKYYAYNDYNTLITLQEDVGDMLCSNYIIIQDRNYPTMEGKIQGWEINNKQYSHRIYHDVNNGLSKIQILYKNMYL